MTRILLVDDDRAALDSTQKILQLSGFTVVTAQDGEAALEILREDQNSEVKFNVILSDIRMPKMGGLDLYKAIKFLDMEIPFVLMTAFGTVEDAVWALKEGVVDFLSKPFKRATLLQAIETANKAGRVRALPLTSQKNKIESLIGHSASILELKRIISQIAPTQATVLIHGESGTGKDLVARLIHSESARRDQPMVAINCAAIPESLLESELFGFEKGAFSGADKSHEGLVEAARGGTLFLDEIGDMPLSLQSKLLRLLQQGEVRRLGSTQSFRVDIRVIAASHQDLSALVNAGKFRQDLLYRLQVIELSVPPLRERIQDLDPLIHFFVDQFSNKYNLKNAHLDDEVLSLFQNHTWPGNVRELENTIERTLIMAGEGSAKCEHLPEHLRMGRPLSQSIAVTIGSSLKDVEELLIRKTLQATDGDQKLTAKLLGIHTRTISRRLEGKT
jgi:DNA-binding NtrC family response regulator